jgi:starvation-inducible DNA-binding protein
MGKLQTTRNDVPEKARKAVVALCNATLADALDLALSLKQAHWNVKGPQFQQLHELFDLVYTHAAGWADLVAERAVQLGGTAEGTLAHVRAATRLPAYTLGAADGEAHLAAVAGVLAAFAATTRAAIDAAADAGDAGSADLFTEVSREADKDLWFVEAHLQGRG